MARAEVAVWCWVVPCAGEKKEEKSLGREAAGDDNVRQQRKTKAKAAALKRTDTLKLLRVTNHAAPDGENKKSQTFKKTVLWVGAT